ncbi:MAG: type III-B CRISPR module RAMP protein Cmr4 [Gammaproteobacteria bacterium]|nr:type III-B CRISPR module RAMP protein Cmr4 [Gammaproteobacteria bacterium]
MNNAQNTRLGAWVRSTLSTIYTLSPLHVGSGQAGYGVDLPIARDAVTGFPMIPATALKGVARECFEGQQTAPSSLQANDINRLFGPLVQSAAAAPGEIAPDEIAPGEIAPDETAPGETAAGEAPNPEQDTSLYAAALAFTEARLLAYPARSLNRPFVHATCPMILARLSRDLNVLGIQHDQQQALDDIAKALRNLLPSHAAVLNPAIASNTLVIEDLVYKTDQIGFCEGLRLLANWCPDAFGRAQMEMGLVMLPDTDFAYLVTQAIPVAARIQLTDGKTTDEWRNPQDPYDRQEGNLWYEEYLPADCLFASFVGQRRKVVIENNADENQAKNSSPSSPPGSSPPQALDLFVQYWALGSTGNGRQAAPAARPGETSEQSHAERVVQIGGNETVGQGLCTWRFLKSGEEQCMTTIIEGTAFSDLGAHRTRYAWQLVNEYGRDAKALKELKDLTAGLPVALRLQGALQTVLGLNAGQELARELASGLLRWLTQCGIPFAQQAPQHPTGWIKILVDADRQTYIAAQQELLALAQALKLFSKGMDMGKAHQNAQP